MITTKETPVAITQKNMIKKSKLTNTKVHQKTKKRKQDMKQGKTIYKTTRKQLKNDKSKSLPINNYFKCKQIKFCNQITYND